MTVRCYNHDVMAKSKQRATYEDLLRLPEHLVGEIIDGELIASPRPAMPHAKTTSIMGMQLGPFGLGGGGSGLDGWWIVDEPELHLHGDVVVPDLAGWRRERMPRIPNSAAVELPSDWICEVVSPRSGRIDRVAKKAFTRASRSVTFGSWIRWSGPSKSTGSRRTGGSKWRRTPVTSSRASSPSTRLSST